VRVVAFSGSRVVPERCESALAALIDETPADLYVTGACVGVDQAIATLIANRRPMAKQRIIVPRDRSRVDQYWLTAMGVLRNVEFVVMPRGTTYRDRNISLLGDRVIGWPEEFEPMKPDLLIALPMFGEKDERSLRSGTWQTVRLASESQRRIETHITLLSVLALRDDWVHTAEMAGGRGAASPQ
jgi:hypothetical protein